MRARYVTTAILWFLVICSAEAKDCSQLGKDASTKASIEYVQHLIAYSEYQCAVQTTSLLARSFATLPNRDGFDARFALREIALELAKNSNIPLSFRVELAEAAAGAMQRSKQIPEVEIIADIRFFLNVMKVFQKQSEISGWLDMLGDAIQLNQQLPNEGRAIQSWEIYGIDKVAQKYVYDSYSADEWEKLIKIAEITQGDKDLLAFRSQLANWFSWWVPGLYDNRRMRKLSNVATIYFV